MGQLGMPAPKGMRGVPLHGMPLPPHGIPPPPHGMLLPPHGIDDIGDIGDIGDMGDIGLDQPPNGELPGMPKPEPGKPDGQLPNDELPGALKPEEGHPDDQSWVSLRCLRPRSTRPIASIAPIMASIIAVPRSLSSAP
jgi:hypothetical protein